MWQETSEIPTDGKQTYGNEKQRMEMFLNYEDEEEDEYDEEYKEQFRKMTDEEIERHIGLERVRNVMEGYDREHGIDKIRKMIEEIKKEDEEAEPEEEEYESDSSETQRMKRLQWIRTTENPKTERDPKNYLKKNYLYIIRGCYLLTKLWML